MGRHLVVSLASLVFLIQPAARAADATRVAPIAPSPLAATAELVERQFSPLEAYQIQRKLRALGVTDALGSMALSKERLLVRAPEKPAADGRYGLILLVGSAKQVRFDPEWSNVLDNHGLVLISPDNAGDDAPLLERRIPLALHAYEYARRTYPLDPARVYVLGAEGGSRLAQRLAFTYPDVFTGVVVNSGASELGTQGLPVPAPDALQRLRTQSRLMFATAKWDQPAFSEQQATLKSLRTYCIPAAHVFDNGHTIAGQAGISGRMLADVVREMDGPRGEADVAPGCEDALQRNAKEELERIRLLDAHGNRTEALKALVAFDHAFGRLLLDDEFAVAKQLNPAFFETPGTPAPVQAGH